MVKQGTITSFFGAPRNAVDNKAANKTSKKTSKPAKDTATKSNKRSRVLAERTEQSLNQKSGLKRLKKLSDTDDEDDEDEENFKDENQMTEDKEKPALKNSGVAEGSPPPTKKTKLSEEIVDDEPDEGSSDEPHDDKIIKAEDCASPDKPKKETTQLSKKDETEDVKEDDDDDQSDDENEESESPLPKKKSTVDMEEEDESDESDEEDKIEKSPPANQKTKVKESRSKSSKSSKLSPVSLNKSSNVKLDSSRLDTKRTWKDGQPVPYKFVTEAFKKVEEISGRLEIQAILTQLMRDILSTTPEDIVPTIYLCINKLAPAHHGIELGIGESILLKALSQVTGRSVSALKETYKKIGDLGDVASSARTKQKTMFPPPPLTVRKVYSELKNIAQISGKNTQDTKCAKIVKMMVAASKGEAKYLSRALLGKLRIHLADKTVIAALSAAVTLEHRKIRTDILLTGDGKKKSKMSRKEEEIEEELKAASGILNAVYSQLPVWDVIVPKLMEFGKVDERLVNACKLIPGVPVSPMLAKPTKAISEVLERFEDGSFTCEYKYDGERAQVHRLADGSMKVYSRNAEDLTPKYPDLIRDLPKALHSDFSKATFIIDAETVAYDVEKKQILPFQELQGRKRKDVAAEDVKVKVCLFAFDLLFFADESMISKSLSDRRKRLHEGFVAREGQFMFAEGHDSRDPEQIMELLNESIKAGCEGLMVKALDGANSTYEPANRSQNWLKVKKDYLDGCGDSLDLVPIGGYLGRGKRTGTFGAFLLACYDPDAEEYQSICKIGTGFTEADLDDFAKFYNADEHPDRISKTAKSYYRAPEGDKLEPDVWFEPVQVWEVKCADLSISPLHTAAVGHVDQEKGIALRFPRFLRVRDDKKVEEATSSEQVAEFYLRQSSVANQS